MWTSLLSFGLNVVFIRAWGFMGAAWAQLVFNAAGYVVTDAVLSRRLRPENRSYLLNIVFLGAILLAGLNAVVLVRVALLVLAGGGSVLLFPGLRGDLGHVWNSQVGARWAARRGR